VSSTQGSLTGQSDPESEFYQVVLPGYNASKPALNQITVALSKLLADTPIKGNSICPGWVHTDLGRARQPRRGAADAEEAAPIVVKMALIPDDGPTGQFVDRDARSLGEWRQDQS
jgi:NAD(P)-dependent dehydrogenase (short-subunit alcohol dehydrogenase family)